jgi:hypothetical protein
MRLHLGYAGQVRLHLPGALLVLIGACGRDTSSGSGDESGVSLESTTTSSEASSITTATSSDETDDSGDGDGDGDGDGPDRDFGDCFSYLDIGPPYVQPNVMFVVDTSSSMREGWDDDQDPLTPAVTRWSTAHGLLYQAFQGLDSYACRMGLQRAPSSAACAAATVDDPMCTDADVCLVEPIPEIELGDFQRAEILAALPDASASPLEIVGGSPLREAYLSARDHLLDQAEDTIDLIVLITDGGASCSEPTLPEAVEIFDAELVADVAEGFEVYGVQTLVVGVGVADEPTLPAQPDSPDVDTQAALNDLAMAGGHPWNGGMEPRKYFDATTPEDLVVALEGAGCGAVSCTIDIEMLMGGPVDPILIPYVIVENDDGNWVPYVRNCELEDGWAWVTEGEVISLCGTYCDAYMTCETYFQLGYGFCGE